MDSQANVDERLYKAIYEPCCKKHVFKICDKVTLLILCMLDKSYMLFVVISECQMVWIQIRTYIDFCLLCPRQSFNLTTFSWASLDQAINKYSMHILSLESDSNSS